MRARRAVAEGALIAGLLAGLTAGPVTALLGQAEPEPRSASADPRTVRRAAVVTPVLVIAHRGFSDIAPENTVPAMRAAADAGADMIELDAGSWKGPQFAGIRIPTLDQVLATIHPTASGLLLELKNPALYPGSENQIVHALARHGFIGSGRIHVHSVDDAALATFHGLAPSVPLGVITEDATGIGTSGHDTWLGTIEPATDTDPDSAEARHLKVLAWPLDAGQSSSTQVERLVDDGVDGIITDNPILVRHEITAAGATTT